MNAPSAVTAKSFVQLHVGLYARYLSIVVLDDRLE